MNDLIAPLDIPPEQRAVDVVGLTKRFGDKTVVDQLSMRVRRGEVFGFLGPNGSGKTTSIRMMCGLLTPDAGSGHTLGYDILREAAAIKREVGYMTQRFGLYEDLTIRENLDFVAGVYQMDRRRQRVDTAIERLGLGGRANQLAGGLSGGWKQRMALAACMLHEPKLLLLDEPTAGVDPKARRDFWEEIHALAAEGITVLVSTHYMDEAERCHRLGYIAYGQLLALGTPAQLVERSGFATWHVRGNDVSPLAAQLRGAPGVDMLTRFGNTLHVSGSDAAALVAAIAPWRDEPALEWSAAAPQLEDVFIHLMGQTRDNFQEAH
ncbi:ABC transporter ATP-binding protein [Niveibacterium microcysteis]|uniref:ABC transporter ATP-binding protein n=1 Tax=Niveibacterium microcysteis TaxID=2811415 RepID=A0ABX7M7V3_9RHOO|nr:ABC transporter ATP-binding protein [Niveibacterium microcysteis]QSI76981.1 ABC transporter ATP-binding protein [Niveibacterium microcysteis]